MLTLTASAALGATPSTHARKAALPPPPPQESVSSTTSNPLLPPPIPLEQFFLDLTLVPKTPTASPTPAGFDPLYTQEDWQAYRDHFGPEADGLNRQKSSGLIAFSNKLLAAAAEPGTSPGLQRLLTLRAAIDCYRTRDGFTTANKAMVAYEKLFDLHSAMQVGALWSMANAMSRTVTTPKPQRIHYSAVAARANMQLTLLLLDCDQLAAAQALVKTVVYHEGWVHTAGALPADKTVHRQIAQVRALVRQTTATLDYLATQYEPAINGDDQALMAIYLYGRYVKNKPAIVADLPGRKPSSPLAQLAASLAAADRDPESMYTAAETLRIVASTLPEGVLKQRTLYAALQNYRAFMAAPQTERDRIKRTLARMATEAVIADGARGPAPLLNPFAQAEPATQPTTESLAPADEQTASAETPPTTATTAPSVSLPNMPTPSYRPLH